MSLSHQAEVTGTDAGRSNRMDMKGAERNQRRTRREKTGEEEESQPLHSSSPSPSSSSSCSTRSSSSRDRRTAWIRPSVSTSLAPSPRQYSLCVPKMWLWKLGTQPSPTSFPARTISRQLEEEGKANYSPLSLLGSSLASVRIRSSFTAICSEPSSGRGRSANPPGTDFCRTPVGT